MANILTYTEQFDNAAWATGKTATVTADSAAAPAAYGANATMADTIEDTSASAQQIIYQTPSKSAGDTSAYIASVFVKKTPGSNPTVFPGFVLQFRPVANASKGIHLNTDTGAVAASLTNGDPGVGNYGCVDIDANWWRIWLKYADPNANTAVRFIIQPAITGPTIGGGDTSTPVGSIVCWGANLMVADTLQEYEPHPSYMFGSGLSIHLWEVSQ